MTLVEDINQGTGNLFPQQFVEFNSELYFRATGFDGTTNVGQELFKVQTDGAIVCLICLQVAPPLIQVVLLQTHYEAVCIRWRPGLWTTH